MKEFNVTNQDTIKAEKIRRQYLSKEANKMEQLKKLDDKVKTPGKIVASILGITGSLVMGAGMSFIMVWKNLLTGLILSIPGMIILLLSYPTYSSIIKSRKKKFGPEIMKLSNDLIEN